MKMNNDDDTDSYNNVIDKLQNYILNNTVIERSLQNKMDKIVEQKHTKIFEYKKKDEKIKTLNQKDLLFWYLYLFKHDEIIEKINIVLEKKLKIEYIDKIRQNKQLIKLHKFATLTHLENQLANEEKIDLKTFFTLCVIENINILYISKKTYFELLLNDDKIHIIHHLDNYSKYGYEENTQSIIELYRSTLFKIDNIEKPIKPITSYKILELIEYCNKLGIETHIKDTTKNKCKKDLYESLIKYF